MPRISVAPLKWVAPMDGEGERMATIAPQVEVSSAGGGSVGQPCCKDPALPPNSW